MRDDAGSAEAQIVLEGMLHSLDLPHFRLTSELPDEFGALRQASRAERMTFREETTRRVRDECSAVGVVSVVNEPLCSALGSRAKRLVGQKLICREAVMEFDDLNVFRTDARGRGSTADEAEIAI